uniref:DOMON domain-containing protein n=1 Tax=Heterorhabditis bacteriophora TaxID=37862 RepID=A0A1I7XUK4_HETBA
MWLSIILCYFSLTSAHPTMKAHITEDNETNNKDNSMDLFDTVPSNSWNCPSDASCYATDWKCVSNCSIGLSGYNDSRVLICIPKSNKVMLAYDKSQLPIEVKESMSATFISGGSTNRFIACTFSIPVISAGRSNESYELVSGEWQDELVIGDGSPLIAVESVPMQYRNISWAVDKIVKDTIKSEVFYLLFVVILFIFWLQHIIDVPPDSTINVEDKGNYLDRDHAATVPVFMSIIFSLTYLGFI